MDVVRSLLGDSNFFVGSPPKNKDEYLNRFLLQMGYSASAITTHKGRLLRQPRRHQDMASRSGPRGIEDGVPVSRMFFERYLRKSGQVDLTPENVDSIISRSNYLEDNSEDELAFVKADDASDLKKQKQKQKRKATDGGKLKAGSLLKPLAMAFTAEMFEFSFPYLVLHRWSWKFLRQIKSVCDPVLRRLHGPAYLDQEKQLPFTVGYILMTFAEDPDGDGKELMRIAAGEFNGLVCQKGIGNVTITAARKMYGLEFEEDDDDSDSSVLPDLE
ncbi:Ank-repeat mbp1 [Fusarium subglutinans]|uniref:Ank-repeat mbp1 n=1 Tax=Gibberella subglutinans TaxID=42677 RepID=A0A8H5LE63_GIBSU|nr:Ank-repeat mbp1 [Fusarium subglutinans]KAF5588725.1 Ank-repeat mbp1 [Fusarium subglutinans]